MFDLLFPFRYLSIIIWKNLYSFRPYTEFQDLPRRKSSKNTKVTILDTIIWKILIFANPRSQKLDSTRKLGNKGSEFSIETSIVIFIWELPEIYPSCSLNSTGHVIALLRTLKFRFTLLGIYPPREFSVYFWPNSLKIEKNAIWSLWVFVDQFQALTRCRPWFMKFHIWK